jgi:membrane-bound serine protease (ClpP class)
MNFFRIIKSTFILIPAFLLFASGVISDEITTDGKNPGKTRIYVFSIRDEIGKPSWRVMQQALQEASDYRADYILLHLNTYGGLVNIADSMRTRIINSPIPLLAFTYFYCL